MHVTLHSFRFQTAYRNRKEESYGTSKAIHYAENTFYKVSTASILARLRPGSLRLSTDRLRHQSVRNSAEFGRWPLGGRDQTAERATEYEHRCRWNGRQIDGNIQHPAAGREGH